MAGINTKREFLVFLQRPNPPSNEDFRVLFVRACAIGQQYASFNLALFILFKILRLRVGIMRYVELLGIISFQVCNGMKGKEAVSAAAIIIKTRCRLFVSHKDEQLLLLFQLYIFC